MLIPICATPIKFIIHIVQFDITTWSTTGQLSVLCFLRPRNLSTPFRPKAISITTTTVTPNHKAQA